MNPSRFLITNAGFLSCSLMLIVLLWTSGCQPDLPKEVQEAYIELPEQIDYNFHVKPILADRCYACHGPDEASRKAGLRLDVEEEAFMKLASGNRAFSKGNLSNSEVYHRMISQNPETIMPPPESNLYLTPKEIATIAKWVEQGAEWKQHWSFIKVESPEIPEVEENWQRNNPIDNFIQAELIRQDLQPNPIADKERLLRRVTMDLTGLPPTIQEIDDFLNDESADAFEKVVDKLLATQEHAERLTMEWLDVARYADSHGVSFDGYREMWPYRDWVIQAFKKNIPYSEFISKQVAGDLLPNGTVEDKLATAFYRLNPMEASAGSIQEEYRVEYVAERTATTGTAFLGLTIGCARCHDHKFDPISQKNFFQLSAFFNSIDEFGLGPTDLNRAPTLLLYKASQKRSLDSLDQLILTKEKELNNLQAKEIRDYVAELKDSDKIENEIGSFSFEAFEKIKREKKKFNPFAEEQAEEYKKKTPKEKAKIDSLKKVAAKKKEYEEVLILDQNKKSEATLGVELVPGKAGKAVAFDSDYDYVSLNKVGFFDQFDSFSASVWINPADEEEKHIKNIIGNSTNFLGFYRGWEMFLDSANHLAIRLIHRLPDDYIEVASTNEVATDQWSQVAFTYDGTGKAKGVSLYLNGEKLQTITLADKLTRSILPIHEYTAKLDTLPLRLGKSYRLYSFDPGIFKGLMDEVKLYDRLLTGLETAILGGSDIKKVAATPDKEFYLAKEKSAIAIRNELRELRKQRVSVLGGVQEVMVMEDMPEPRQTFLLKRGIYNDYGETVEPSTPENVLTYPEEYPKNRLGLAKWLVNAENPLTSRVIINRYWQMIFGSGIVKTSGDFGIQGDLPTHPELLDWLASEFMESGWDLRKMLKLMVMSATYQQSSYADQEKYEADPENKYYSRSSSYRLPAEFIRDNALASSGVLNKKVGGPSVKPYQPEGLWEELGDFSYTLHKYKQDTGSNLHRRSLYTFTRRFSPAPYMITFDASNREICITKRVNTNTPLQALNLLNAPQFVEASRVMSERVIKEKESLDEQLILSFRLATGVTPNEKLLGVLKEHYESAFHHFQEFPMQADSLLAVGELPRDKTLDKAQAAAMAVVANSILNFDETYMRR
ncbi:DUF1553 domain-containing protein [Algoriphagus pacificus]|uniref:DUF1553 domain-containing protein n=1 Tax=Algoriphagus pacificus TaxID=2811234 RepID=A0ABS3CD31_9BACT|nr:DUF1553 domain-containing protein [Algoriphagus pacificus]MBN7815000.1 DUF1553 domain-containing protein [Algoriphagus pacificus]